ncbi:hypothetical protein B484DRAFT_398732 [Ochromonadaceae sp. CCMP2298]|nr:hypothetical protein B484DRAFT_398732 [Ochromonadaceae sp. CCMP2298]
MSGVSSARSALTLVCVLSLLRSAFCTQCPEGYLLHDDTCYYFAPQSQGDVLYSACASTCAAQGATTLCVEDATQNTWINSVNQRATWLGFDKSSGTVVWPSGCGSSYTNWYSGENNAGEANARIQPNSYNSYGGQWEDVPSDHTAYCACQKAPAATPGALYCPTDSIYTQPQCQTLCANRGAYLTCIESAAEHDTTWSYHQTEQWVGIEYSSGWHWPYGSCPSSYTNFPSGEGSAASGETNVMQDSVHGGRWADVQGTTRSINCLSQQQPISTPVSTAVSTAIGSTLCSAFIGAQLTALCTAECSAQCEALWPTKLAALDAAVGTAIGATLGAALQSAIVAAL